MAKKNQHNKATTAAAYATGYGAGAYGGIKAADAVHKKVKRLHPTAKGALVFGLADAGTAVGVYAAHKALQHKAGRHAGKVGHFHASAKHHTQ